MKLKKFFLFSAVVPLVLSAVAYYFLKIDLLGGRTELRGGFEDIDIYVLDYGVKAIEAKTYEGAMYGLGFVNARDRLWQMFFLRMLARGRVSEFGGEDTLMIDQTIRMLGVNQIPEKQLPLLDQESVTILEAFSQGINDFVDNMKVYPLEFYLTWTSFDPWTPADTLLVQGLLQYFVSFDWFLEITREKLVDIYDFDIVEQMMPYKEMHYYFNDTTLINDEDLIRMGNFDSESNLYEIDHDLLYYRKAHEPKKEKLSYKKEHWHHNRQVGNGMGIGSNCWAVSGDHTESGKPILSCDPHLMKWMQSKWYMVKLSWGDGNYLAGGSTPGLPLFTYARSKDVAWGATALNPDLSDLFIEQVEGDKYFYDGEWHPFKKHKETFKVKGQADVELVYNYTHNGVMMLKPEEDKMDFAIWFPLEFLSQSDQAYSLRWVYTDPQPSKLFSSLKRISEVGSSGLSAFEMLDQLVSFPLNVVFVASNGDIGYAMTGLHPQRKHNVVHGVYPKKGWLKENQWVGLINNKLLPRVLNPKAGYIVSANNLITSSNTKFGISHSFSFPHRFLRIRELLQEKIGEKKKLNYQDMMEIQLDVLDIQARESLRYMLPSIQKGIKETLQVGFDKQIDRDQALVKVSKAIEILERWDFRFGLEGVGQSLFTAWEVQMSNYFQELKIDNEDVRRAIAGNVLIDNFLYAQIREWSTEKDPKREFCSLKIWHNKGLENNCHHLMAFTFVKAIEDLEHRLGKDMGNWDFKRLQYINYEHSPFSKTPLRYLFEEHRNIPGNRRTPQVAMFFFHKEPYSVKFGPILRMINDMGDTTKFWGSMDTGVEQVAFSPHRADFMELFHQGGVMEIPLTNSTQFTETSNVEKKFTIRP